MPGWTVPDGSPRFGGRCWFDGVRLPGLPGTARFRRLVTIHRSEAKQGYQRRDLTGIVQPILATRDLFFAGAF